MRKNLILLSAWAVAMFAAPMAKADYSNSVMALQPVAYWPLNETNLPPDTIGPAIGLNSGTLGAALNAPFNSVDVVHGYPGALASTTDTADSFNGFNTRAVAPYTTDLAINPSFTIEAWLLAHDDGTVWGTTCPLSTVGINSPRTGWLIYMDINNTGQYTFRTYATNGTSFSLQMDIGAPGSIQVEQWYHLAIVVSNAVTVTNVYAYLNGALVAGPTVLPGYVPSDGNSTGGFSVGGRTDGDGFDFVGSIDEVAYYTNALDPATILSHYQAGTNPSPVTAYSTLVLQKNPILYYRMNEVPTAKSSPYILPLPVATNYGSLGSSINGYYQSGTVPGIPGPTNAAFGVSRACQFGQFGHSTTENGPGVMCAPYNQSALNLNQAMTLLAWVQVPGPDNPGWFQTPIGRGDTSFRMDIDPSGFAHFAANPNGDVVGSISLADNLWHLWAGVFDPVAGASYLYVDGALAAQASGSSLVNMSCYLMIGGAPDYNDRNFPGNICHVAIFTNALSGTQIQTLYNSVGAPPTVFLPTNQFSLDEHSTGGITASASGTPPLFFQWYSTDLGTTNLLAGQTSLTLTLTNVSLSQDGLLYFIVASNVQGVASSGIAKLTVLSGPPQITRDLIPFEQVPAGVSVTYSVAVAGTEPFHYQWFRNGSTAIAGATASSFTVTALAGTNTYSVTVTNTAGPANSAIATLVGLTSAPPVIDFSGNGNGWTYNQGNVVAGGFSGNVLTVTDGTNGEVSTAFFNLPQYIGGFVAFFTYQEANGDNPLADGATFAIQNSPSGVNASGGGGGQLGFGGLANSAAFEMNIYPPSSGGVGIQFATNGMTPTTPIPASPYMSTAPVNIASGNPINVRLFYNQGTLGVQLVDTVSNSTYRTTLKVGSIPEAVNGSSALIGFTGATGGLNSIQRFSNFRFAYTTPPILAVNKSGANALITWPVSVTTLFGLQQSSSVNGPWANVATAPTIVNGQNQVSFPLGTAQFYRLILQ